MEQLDLFSTIPTEEWVFELLKPALEETLSQNNAGTENIDITRGKQYSSVSFIKYDTYDPSKLPKKHMVFRICCRDSQYYFGISDAYATYIPSDYASLITKVGKTDGYRNYEFIPTPDGITKFFPLLSAILDAVIDSIPKEFDCCSRYEECSNRKRCIHPKPAMAISCGYRKIMKNGRIFYCTNQNI